MWKIYIYIEMKQTTQWSSDDVKIAESSGIFYAIIEREWTLNLGQIRNVLVVTFNLF